MDATKKSFHVVHIYCAFSVKLKVLNGRKAFTSHWGAAFEFGRHKLAIMHFLEIYAVIFFINHAKKSQEVQLLLDVAGHWWNLLLWNNALVYLHRFKRYTLRELKIGNLLTKRKAPTLFIMCRWKKSHEEINVLTSLNNKRFGVLLSWTMNWFGQRLGVKI